MPQICRRNRRVLVVLITTLSQLIASCIPWPTISVVSCFQPDFVHKHPRSLLFNRFVRLSAPLRATSTSPKKQRYNIAIVGSGAVGSYYGARLFEAGHSVKWLFRGENFNAAQSNGLTISSVDGDMYIPPDDLETFETTAQIGQVDWVVVALKSSSLEAIPSLLKPLLSPTTRVLVIMNGLIEEDLIRLLKEDNREDDLDAPLKCCKALYGGMALICSNRLSPAVVAHTYGGLLSAGVASTQSSDKEEDHRAFSELWENSRVSVTFEESLRRGRWKKCVWNLPFNGISVAMGGITVDRIVNDAGLRKNETIAAANAELEQVYGPGNFEPLGEEDKEQMMTLSDNMGAYKTSTMLDFTNRRAMEVKYLFRVPVERARRIGVHVPQLETVVILVEALQKSYGL